jgi:hypothetical protein
MQDAGGKKTEPGFLKFFFKHCGDIIVTQAERFPSLSFQHQFERVGHEGVVRLGFVPAWVKCCSHKMMEIKKAAGEGSLCGLLEVYVFAVVKEQVFVVSDVTELIG